MPKTNAHIYVLSAGHRNTTRGGAPGEIDWTPGATDALRDALEALGATVYVVMEDDGDSDPTFTNDGLWAVGRIATRLDRAHGPITAFLSLHYGGEPVRGFFAIVPDSGGLRTAVDGSTVTGDAVADNPLDLSCARNIANRVRLTKTIPLRSSLEAGVMSERATGVGGDGWRLSEMQETKPIRGHAVRLILEAGNILTPGDAAYIRDPRWVRDVYARAIVDGLRDTFGPFPKETGAGVETPKPDPVVVAPSYAPPNIPDFVRDGTLPTVDVAGTTWRLIDDEYQTVRDTPRLQFAAPDAKRIGPDVPAGTIFDAAYIGRSASDGKDYLLSPWGTRILAADTKRLGDVPSR